MRGDSKACCIHQNQLFKLITSIKDHQSSTRMDNPKPPSSSPNNSVSKIKHANALYNKWKSKKSQENHSRRLGLSYRTNYRANTQKHLLINDKRFMYLKHYSNFKINQNFKHKTKMKQEKRRECIKKRILKPCESNATRDEGSQMLALRRKGYLFHENYYFYKRILHLQYHTKKIPNIKNYSYHIPYFLLPSHTRTRLHSDNTKIKNSQQIHTPLTSPT
jgi:hypothetical protein